jgi:sugar lactone lactonase YvrE
MYRPLIPAVAILLSFCNLRADVLTTYPEGTNLESIAVSPGGDLFVTSVYDGTVYDVSPSGSSRVFGHLPDVAVGAAFTTDGTLLVSSGTSLYRFDSGGAPSLAVNIPGAQDLNGLTAFGPGKVLVADDAAATIWQVDLKTGATHAWLSGGLLQPQNPDLPIGPNGIKVFNGAVYITNTGSGNVIRVPILADGSAGAPSVFASGLPLDDFAFGSDGSLFLATQTENSVIRLFPDGTRSTIATDADGLLGDSALAFGQTPSDSQDIYVVNNGGQYEGLNGPGSIVRLNVGITGLAPELQTVPEPSTLSLVGVIAMASLLFRKWNRRRRVEC